jgi:hypothetical protein
MELKNTIQAMQKLGNKVVREGKGILKRFKPHSKISSGALYNEFDYDVRGNTKKESVTLTFKFGRASDYWDFVDEGVQATSQARPKNKDGKPYPRKKGKRAAKSPFRFRDKMPPRGAIDRWVVKRGLKAARKDGKFINRKSLVFLIQRSIFYNGLQRTQFFTRPFTKELKNQTDDIVRAFGDDLDKQLELIIND